MTTDYRSVLIEESARLRELVAAGPLDGQVPSCPGWTLGDVGVHVIGVQRFSTHVLNHGEPTGSAPALPAHSEAAALLPETTEALVAALDTGDPNDPCWNFGSGPQVRAFWSRRQAMEVALHRWDAESVTSPSPDSFTPPVAADMIDELIKVMMPRAIQRNSLDISSIEGDVHVHCTDTAGEWTFEVVDGALRVSDEHRKSAVAVRGEAAKLVLFLYNRIGIEQVDVFGDQDVLANWAEPLQI